MIDILPGMTDSHFHALMMQQKGLCADSLFDTYFKRGFAGGIDIGTKAGDTRERFQLHEKNPQISLAAGLYPSEVENPERADLLKLLIADLERYPISAIGEIGLDYHWNYGTPASQKELFAQQIEIANQYNLPIIIHNREADHDIEDIIHSIRPRAGGILHCFSADYSFAKRLAEFGFFISFAGNITYKRNHQIQEAARRLPISKILIETDSPYLSPDPVRGRINHPGHIGYIYSFIAGLKGIEVEELISQVHDNLKGLIVCR